MGRFDALTTLDTKPVQTTPPPVKSPVVQPTNQPESTQTNLHANQQTSKDASMQTRKSVNLQTSKPVSMQTSKQVNLQTSKQVTLQTGKQVFIEKYSSYLPHEFKKELKRIALESDREQYEVLIEAVELYLTERKQPK